MNGYSKISTGTAHKSRSIDFSDFFSFPQTPKPSMAKHGEPDDNKVKKIKTQNSSPEADEREEGGGGGNNGEMRFGMMMMGRSGSVSAASGFQATMKRAFSMRRSSSVSERYCRIHDQYMAIASPIGEETDGERIRSVKKKQRGGKILKACKRLLRL
ncbi:uncharacterized protein LOC133318091 [Gastrolobium bilobum]|uniref:uncharacterized protein LOC133318091 n=1 Tax=Gastrolobium bilobum TaxID=150636 RepID=UPI002AAF251E|nr:uncharacterized protein LOC133318091 [Gastrolobium bilobum]